MLRLVCAEVVTGDMRKVLIFLIAIVLATAGALPVSVSARAELKPGGWLQPPRVLPAPPPAEAAPPPQPAAVQPTPLPPPRPKVAPPVQRRPPPPVRTAPSDGKVQF
jgi:hypothetical protein